MSQSELRSLPQGMSFSSGNVADNWRRFKQKVEFYFDALGGNKLAERKKVGILMTALGDAGIEIFNTFSDIDETSGYDEVIDAFDQYCNPKKNTVYERFLFSKLTQGSQSVEAFIVNLKNQARKCEFADVESENLVRDRLVVGINNEDVRKQMLRDAELTLEKATNLAKIWAKSEVEAAEMAKVIEAPASSSSFEINRVQRPTAPRNRDERPNTDQTQCRNCGYVHYADKCPAMDRECNYCHKPGHFASVCRKKTSRASMAAAALASEQPAENPTASANASEPERAVDVLQLFAVRSASTASAWYTTIRVANAEVSFKVDSGAECNTLLVADYERLRPKPRLIPTAVVLRPYGEGELISPRGEIRVPLKFNEREYLVSFFVVDFPSASARPSDNILGLPTIEVIGLVKRLFSATTVKDQQPAVFSKYPEVFDGKLGAIPGQAKLLLRSSVEPVAEKPRRFPFALKDKLKEAITQLEKAGVITKVNEPTEWVSNLIAVKKPNGSIRICMDPKHLNEALIIPKCEIPRCDDIFAELHDKQYYTVFDLKDGFWQIHLDHQSSLVTTFNSPFGRYRWRRLVMGISSAPEIFMNKMRELFGDLKGVYPYFDDIIVAGTSEKDHDENLEAVLRRAQEVGIRFNPDKVQFKQPTVQYLGFQVGRNAVKPLPKHVKAIVDMPRPSDRNGVLRILGMIRYLARFIPSLAANTECLRRLTRKNCNFEWLETHETEFQNLKKAIQNATDLRFYSPSAPLNIQTDSSKSGLGCCLFQDSAPISYASRALTKTEENYAQVEKEFLAVVFAFEKFHDYTYGRPVTVFSDHRPLVAIVKKPIAELTPRLQRLRLRLLRYNFRLVFQPGKELYVADTLSRAYLTDEKADESYQELEVHVCTNVVASPAKLAELVGATAADPELQSLKVYLKGGWPKSKRRLTPSLSKYRTFANKLRYVQSLFFFENRIVIPSALVSTMLNHLHAGHLNVNKTKQLARKTLFWLNMNTDIELFISDCQVCNKFRKNNSAEPLRPYPCPTRPWQRLHTDLFVVNEKNYLAIYDAYSQWLEIFQLKTKTCTEIILNFKTVFARFGIPVEIVSDNSPYNSAEWHAFAEAWKFTPLFSSPRFPQSNGAAEKAVAIAKSLLQKNTNVQYSLLQYRNAPIPHLGHSPAQLLMGRTLRTCIPVTEEHLQPTVVDHKVVLERKLQHQARQKFYFDKGTRELPPLKVGDEVYYKRALEDKEWKPGAVVAVGPNPRSYEIGDAENQARYLRNRRFIRKPLRYRDG